MPRIRYIEITHFRGIRLLQWHPGPGVNCLIGSGDSGKSTILDAIDLCLGQRRTVAFSDADFHQLDTSVPIGIDLTIGELDDSLRSIEGYGDVVRGYDALTETIEDEPGAGLETVLTVRLQVTADLEPQWTLYSNRARDQGIVRHLTWADRARLAPMRIGASSQYHLSWGRGSVLTRIADEQAGTAGALAQAARDARRAFGTHMGTDLATTLATVAQTAQDLGVPVGPDLSAMLDPDAVTLGSSTIALHDGRGVPLRTLGTGSSRLLVAGLHRTASRHPTILLVDEVEYGLEPHRIIRLLGSLGAKEATPPQQAFVTTHSPVVLRELAGDQLIILRPGGNHHQAQVVGNADGAQGTIREFPEAFLATRVVVCEGASEVGFLRGIDLHRMSQGLPSIFAAGASLVDGRGGQADRPVRRASSFAALGYRTAIVRDNDQQPAADVLAAYARTGGADFTWRDDRALEQELCASLTTSAIGSLLDLAVSLHGESRINSQIVSASQNQVTLANVRAHIASSGLAANHRQALGLAAKGGDWFKTVSRMENLARTVVGPDLGQADPAFAVQIEAIFRWIHDAP
jgi:putative ATP-dependent endonuclease of the OLD family